MTEHENRDGSERGTGEGARKRGALRLGIVVGSIRAGRKGGEVGDWVVAHAAAGAMTSTPVTPSCS